jgi:hypothetical protein
MVAQLLEEFVPAYWLREIDLGGLERINAKFHAEAGERREGDMIWKQQWRQEGRTAGR